MRSVILPLRPRHGHKGTFGTAMIVAGSNDYLGAPILSAKGCLFTGVGICAMIVPPAVRGPLITTLPEVTMPNVVVMTDTGVFDSGMVATMMAIRHSALLMGPGLGNAQQFVGTVLETVRKEEKLVLDADALNCLANTSMWWTTLPALDEWAIITPHPGEMSRLSGQVMVKEDEARQEWATRCATLWNCVVLLKGANTVVAAPDGRMVTIPISTPALAVGGSGDVLAGVIVSLRAQGLAPFDAAVTGATLHGEAGLDVEATIGCAGGLASEIATRIPRMMMKHRKQEE